MSGTTNRTLDIGIDCVALAIDIYNFTFVTCACQTAIIVNNLVIFIRSHTDRLIKIECSSQQRREFLHNIAILLARAIVASNNRMHECQHKPQKIYKAITNSNNGSSECHWILCGGICFDWIVLWRTPNELCHFADLLSFARIFAYVFRLPSFSHAFGRPRASIEANNLFWLTWIRFRVSICHFSSCVISGCHRGVRDMHHTSPVVFICLTLQFAAIQKWSCPIDSMAIWMRGRTRTRLQACCVYGVLLSKYKLRTLHTVYSYEYYRRHHHHRRWTKNRFAFFPCPLFSGKITRVRSTAAICCRRSGKSESF